MNLTIQNFCQCVERDLDGLINLLKGETARTNGSNELLAWEASFPCVARMLTLAMKVQPNITKAQISTATLIPEYKLPAASAWCDLVLIGQKNGRPSVVIIELKNWQKECINTPGVAEGLIFHKGVEYNHPSDQVKGYTEYCRHFHSAIHQYNAEIYGCVFLTQAVDTHPLQTAPNDHLTQEYPVFSTETEKELSRYITDHLDDANICFATEFLKGYYQQDRNILKQVAKALSASVARPFVLLDEQRRGFHKVMDTISKRLADRIKQVVIVNGPPGSGKSAVAINLWLEAIRKYQYAEDIPGNIVMVTTSQSQEHNWSDIFDHFGKRYHAHDLIVKASSFRPTTRNITKSMSTKLPGCSLKAHDFRQLTNTLVEIGEAVNYRDNNYFLSIVDEAHALVNPCAPWFKGFAMGWNNMFGPQAYHIIRESLISVFLTDGEQSFRDQETTSSDDIKSYAQELGADIIEISLHNMQFRCAGSVDYVDWVDHLLDTPPLHNVEKWANQFSVSIVDSPFEMDDYLRDLYNKGEQSVRILSSYAVNWVSKNQLDERHSLPGAEYDFSINVDGKTYRKYWNNPKGHSIFVQGRKNSLMAEDPLCEVGCPYIVRGFDFDHIGLIWLDDLVWRKDHWELSLTKTIESANKNTRSAAKKLAKKKYGKEVEYVPVHMPQKGEIPDDIGIFFHTVFQARRILLTRALKSVCIYVHDSETRAHLRNILK